MLTIQTENSTYEIDTTSKLVRRHGGVNSPTPRFGEDQVWRPFKSMTTPSIGQPVVFTWDDDGVTITSFVELIAGKS